MTLEMNLYKGEKNVTCKKENVHIGMATHTCVEARQLIGFKLPHMKL